MTGHCLPTSADTSMREEVSTIKRLCLFDDSIPTCHCHDVVDLFMRLQLSPLAKRQEVNYDYDRVNTFLTATKTSRFRSIPTPRHYATMS